MKPPARWKIITAVCCCGLGHCPLHAQTPVTTANVTAAAPASPSQATSANLGNITVIGQMNEARSEILPDLGATAYAISKEQIETQAQGANSPFNQVLLRAPGVAQDSLGQVHLRGEHANLQYRINGVLLPEGITGFGQELDPRFVDSLQVITGSLPAQYGYRTAGIIDIQTKQGAFNPGGQAEVYGGSYDTVRPSAEYGGSAGNFNYFVNGSYDHNGIGVENPTASANPLHDDTDQYRAFSYFSYLLSDTARVTGMAGASYANFQIPNTPNLGPGTAPGGANWRPGSFNSAQLNENQNEQNYYAIAALQRDAGNLNYQLAAFGRYSSVHFSPDPTGDLFFNGVASDVTRKIYSGGLQGDASYQLNDTHTLRGGLMVLDAQSPTRSTTTVLNLDGSGNPVGSPFPVASNPTLNAQFYGVYLQDEWRVTPKFTVNYGLRFDAYESTLHENQFSPRLNAIYKITEATTVHAGYARYFTPPSLEAVNSGGVAAFAGTSNAAGTTQNNPVMSERADYFDAGISHKFNAQWSAGLDSYYKYAKNQLDDGFFGQTLIPANFNYHEGQVYGVEATASYTNEGFASYLNAAVSVAQGKQIVSSQFLFDPADLAYIQSHWVYLDHDQRVTISSGASYTWNNAYGRTRIYLDALFGSGLRKDVTDANGATIPNGGHVPPYITINLGAEHDVDLGLGKMLKLRVDVVNAADNVYQLRDGSGIGVNAAQYGMRFGVFGSIGISF